MTDEELREILKDAPIITDEELENEFYHSSYDMFHDIMHDFTNDCLKNDKEEGFDKENRTYSGKVGLDSVGAGFGKVDFDQYRESFNEEKLGTFINGNGEELTVEEVRELMYGYTFTEEYSQEPVTSPFSINWWMTHLYEEGNEYSRQEELIAEAIIGTGDGNTPETAFCVIDLYQEYEILSILMPKRTPLVVGWSLLPGNIDCLKLEPNEYGIDKLYFDMHRRFEVGMDNSKIQEMGEE